MLRKSQKNLVYISKIMKNLFINFVSSNWTIVLFDDNRKIIDSYEENILLNESTKLIWIIDGFLLRNNTNYFDIENFIVVNWPWSFTWIRTITLLVNTLNFVTKKNITEISFFDLFNKFPIVKSSSKRDIFIKKQRDEEIEIISNQDFLHYLKQKDIKKVYWDLINNFLEKNTLIFSKIDYDVVIKKIVFEKKNLSTPLYIKKPNIS